MTFAKKTILLFSLAVAVAILWPITENFKKKPKDDFPFSYYPMFSFKRGSGYTLNYIVGYDAANNRHYIPYKYIGSGGFNQARRQLNKKVKKNQSDELLLDVEARLAKTDKKPFSELVTLKLMKGSFDFDAFFLSNNKLPKDEQIIAFKLIDNK